MENERVREWLRRMWGPQPPCPHSLATTHTHKLSRCTMTVHTHSCAVHLCAVYCQHWACHAYSPACKLWGSTALSYTYKQICTVLYLPPFSSILWRLLFSAITYLLWQEALSLNRNLTGKRSRLPCLFTPGHRSLILILSSFPLHLSFPVLFSPSLKQRLANSKAHTSRFISANLPCNKFKNRLVNIMPFESTRVCLQPIRGVEGSDYINASCIDGYRSAQDSSWSGSLTEGFEQWCLC